MTVMVSLWRNDAKRSLVPRARHLLAKRGVDRWLWGVGDSTDDTEWALCELARASGLPVSVVCCDTGLAGEESHEARERLSRAFTSLLAHIRGDDDLVCLHESDLRSGEDVVEQLSRSGLLPVAGWPTIRLDGTELFYDIWAFRHLDGRRFWQYEPRPRAPVEVSSFGSLWIAPASLLVGRELAARAVVELCEQWRSEGVRLWADPRVRIEQPAELWTWRAVS